MGRRRCLLRGDPRGGIVCFGFFAGVGDFRGDYATVSILGFVGGRILVGGELEELVCVFVRYDDGEHVAVTVF